MKPRKKTFLIILVSLLFLILIIINKASKKPTENFLYTLEGEILCYKPIQAYEYNNNIYILNNCNDTLYLFKNNLTLQLETLSLYGDIVDTTIHDNYLYILITKNIDNNYQLYRFDLETNQLSEVNIFNKFSSLFKSNTLRNYNASFFSRNKLIFFSIFQLNLNDLDHDITTLEKILIGKDINEIFLDSIDLGEENNEKYIVSEQITDNVFCNDDINSYDCSSLLEKQKETIDGEVKYILDTNIGTFVMYYRDKSFYIMQF
jgi:hypothetical protein